MSIESNPAMEKRVEQKEALNLMNEDPFLKEDSLTREVVFSGGKYNGQEIDLGNFLDARRAWLERNKLEEILKTVKIKDPSSYEVAVVSSVRPDLERNIEE